MSRVLFCSCLALLLVARVPQAADNDAAGKEVVVGKVVSLEINDDGIGTLAIQVKRLARVPLPPREMAFLVTKETRFTEAADAGEEGKTVDARKAAAWAKDSAAVTVRYFWVDGKLTARTVSLVSVAPKPDQPAGVPRATDKNAEGDEVAGKGVSLEIQADGSGVLIVQVRQRQRLGGEMIRFVWRTTDMEFQVTKETRFLQRGGPGEEGAALDAHKAAAWVKDSAAVTVRYLSEGGKLTARTVSLVAAPAKPAQPADGLADNAKARVLAAHKAFDLAVVQLRDGKAADGPERVYRWSQRWMEAEQELVGKVAAAEGHLKRMAELAEMVRRLVDAGAGNPGDVAAAEFYRLEAERQVLLAKSH